MIKFYDTNIFLNCDLEDITKSKFIISNITFVELEGIKNDLRKDFTVRAKAQRVAKWLAHNEKKFEVSMFTEDLLTPLKERGLEINNDAKILACAIESDKKDKVQFMTGDLNMYHLAKLFLDKVTLHEKVPDGYKGFEDVYLTDEQLADLYSNLDTNKYKVNINEYLQIFDKDKQWVDVFKWTGIKYEQVKYQKIRTQMFGDVKPLDQWQRMAVDSLLNNQVTMLKGPAGSGKSYLALSYLFSLLEKGDIDKIVVFVNTPAAKGATKLGFYPGTREEKLLSSTVGNILASKLGGMDGVTRMMNDGRLELLPFADIRGYDTSGLHLGIWIVEAQNLSKYLMQLALQRIDDNCKLIIDGDNNTQVDMAEFAGDQNGMTAASKVFRGQDYYGEVTLQQIHRGRVAERAQLIQLD